MPATARVGLLVTCLVDLFRPSIGFAAVKLLEEAGCTVEVPRAQTCCGQPAYNSGDRADAEGDRAQGRSRLLPATTMSSRRPVRAPAWSRCITPRCSPTSPRCGARAEDLASRTYELVSFLVDVRGMKAVNARWDGTVTYHDSCSGLRELGVEAQPRLLLATRRRAGAARIAGGGSLLRLRRHVLRQIPGNLQQDGRRKGGRYRRDRGRYGVGGRSRMPLEHRGEADRPASPIETRHVAEVLAGMARRPPIGDAEQRDARETSSEIDGNADQPRFHGKCARRAWQPPAAARARAGAHGFRRAGRRRSRACRSSMRCARKAAHQEPHAGAPRFLSRSSTSAT